MAASRRAKLTCDSANARMQLEQVFQQPDARDAMDRRQMQRDPARVRSAKSKSFSCTSRVIEKLPFGGGGRRRAPGPGADWS
jgi:hypothetical protein